MDDNLTLYGQLQHNARMRPNKVAIIYEKKHIDLIKSFIDKHA